jgi:SAM-dependent methyltransferase
VVYTERSDLEVVSLQSAEESMTRRGRIAESLIASERPELVDLFLTYQNEAIAARNFLDSSLIELDSGAEVLEVGGGILALAIQLASEGLTVTTVEPVGEGFTGISYIMNVFSEIAQSENLKFSLIEIPIEDCEFDRKFDFIFSINVMEHLNDPYSVLIQMDRALKIGGKYRFFCPNYDFPYEPHFGKWIFSRKNDAFHLKPKFANESKIDLIDSNGLYLSINYLTQRKIKSCLTKHNLVFQSNRNAFYEILVRSLDDSGLQGRHRTLYKTVLLMKRIGLLGLARLFPDNLQPVIDMTILKVKA